MAHSKHKTTGQGTHRERIYKYKQELIAFRKATLQEKLKQAEEVVAEAPWAVSTPAESEVEEAIEQKTITIEPDPVKDDGLGHGLADTSLQDTLREFNGMVNHDKHEQIMDTFVEEAKSEG